MTKSDHKGSGGSMNELTPEVLEMCTKLQPLYREKMGPPKVGDHVYHLKWGNGTVVSIHGSRGIVRFERPTAEFHIPLQKIINEILILPLPIDPVKPERGLEGMLKGDFALQRVSGKYGVATYEINGLELKSTTGLCDTPIEALLKALVMAQEKN